MTDEEIKECFNRHLRAFEQSDSFVECGEIVVTLTPSGILTIQAQQTDNGELMA